MFRQGKDGMRQLKRTSWVGGTAMGVIVALPAVTGPCAAAGKIPCKYDVEILQNDCGLFPSFIQAGGIAENGSIAGMFEACSPPNDRGFLWLPDGTFIPITLPVSPFLYQLAASDVNDAHQVVGTYNAPLSFGGHTGFIYDKGRITALGTFPGGNYSDATAVNRFGIVTGYAGNTSGGLPPHAFIWQDAVMISLGPDLGTPRSFGYDISDKGAITGWTGSSPALDDRAFIWDATKVSILPPVPGGYTSRGNAINYHSDVVGEGRLLDDEGGVIFRAYAFMDGKPHNLGILPGFDFFSSAYDINDDNIIVGACSGPIGAAGFVFSQGNMYDLNDLIDAEPGLLIHGGISINNSGQISADGSLLGHTAVFRLHPILPQPGDLNCDEHVDVSDVKLLLDAWGVCAEPCDADLDGTGVVNGFDLAMLLGNWG